MMIYASAEYLLMDIAVAARVNASQHRRPIFR